MQFWAYKEEIFSKQVHIFSGHGQYRVKTKEEPREKKTLVHK
jgi:hypothetical protein